MLLVIGLSVSILVLAYLGVSFVCRWADRRQLTDLSNRHSFDSRPIPVGGGLAIVIATLLGLMLVWWHDPLWSRSELLAYAIGAGLIATVGWLDDLYSVPVRWRFLAHSLSAVLAILGFGYWHTISVPLLGSLHVGWLGLPLAFLWIVGLTNAYNFMDGIDGIAGAQAVVAGVGWAWLGWQAGLPLIASLGVLLTVSSLGFLGHNWPPARIFMGDVGSTFLGYTFAILAIVAARSDPRFAFAGVLLVAPFVFDPVFTFLRRLRAGENVFEAHRTHLYARLVVAGRQHRFVTLLYFGLALVTTWLALLWSARASWADPLVLPTLSTLCLALWLFVIREERGRVH